MSNSTEILSPAVRLLDSRDFGDSGRLDAEDTTTITVPQAAPDPVSAEPTAVAVQVTLTSVEPRGGGYLTAWPSGAMADVSALNYADGQVVANTTTVPLSSAGTFQIFTKANTHLLVDLVALYRP